MCSLEHSPITDISNQVLFTSYSGGEIQPCQQVNCLLPVSFQLWELVMDREAWYAAVLGQWLKITQSCLTLCPSPTPGAYSNSSPSSWWCHPTISSSVIPFSSCLRSFPASGFFPISQFFASGGQSIGVSASAAVLPMNIQDWLPLGWTDWVSLQSKGFSRVFSNNTVQKHQFFSIQLSLSSNSHIHTWLLEKP